MKSKVIEVKFGVPRIKTLKPNKRPLSQEDQKLRQQVENAAKTRAMYEQAVFHSEYVSNPAMVQPNLHCPECDCTYFKIPSDLHHPAYGNPIDYIKVTCGNCGLESPIQYHSPEPLKA